MLTLKSINFEQQQFQIHHLKQTQPDKMEWLLGRSTACDLVLPNPEVSRVHGKIAYVDDAYYFMDMGSSFGSSLNGTSVPANEKYQLSLADILQLGETFLYVEGITAPSIPPSANEAETYTSVSLPEQPWAGEDLLCRCCRIIDETPDVKTFSFIAEPPVLFTYKPGQFVNLAIDIDGKPVVRSYSISSSPTRPYHLSLTIKRVASPPDQPDIPSGLVSNWMHNHLKVGDRVQLIGGPLGHFTCLPNLPSKLMLISAGSGITPMMSMSRWVQDTLADCDIVFLHCARTPDDLIFRTELETIAAQLPNFHLAVTLTQQPLGQSWMGLTGRISSSLLQMVAPDLLERSVYVCGPEGFMESTKLLLETMKFPMQNYQSESFGRTKKPKPSSQATPSATWHPQPETIMAHNGNGHHDGIATKSASTQLAAPPTSAQASPVVHFMKAERQIPVDDSASILELAEQEGIPIRSACRVGACGACKIRVHKGQVRYDTPPTALTDTDKQAGYALACVAYPNGSLAIEA
ncbi:MAG: 2Fe-2S iron-sulfur cluster binding domain-containing protein [Tildeniella nuda ZEHNDER 1965/U140]|jgi:ferredoxin-NADP reductase/ferredoxin|nr:2Fe-2S iron-sulfur cluster binding domain-containing protein [Tildeniella nuda ZEHNDER 1965/U140]